MNIVKFWNPKGELLKVRISQSNRNAEESKRIPTLQDACISAAHNGWSRVKPKVAKKKTLKDLYPL